MAEFSDYLENKILDHVFRATAYTAPASVYLALYTTNCTDAARGTEVPATNGYARQLTAFNAAAAGSVGNTAQEAFTAAGGAWGTIVCTGIEDAATAGNNLCFDTDFVDTVVNDLDTLQFASTTGVVISLT